MNIIFTVDGPLSHFLEKNNRSEEFNGMLKTILLEFSLIRVANERDADIIFFLTKKDFSKKGREKRISAKKQKKSVPLLSCQEMISRCAKNFISFIKERIKKMLIWPLATKITREEAKSVAMDYGKNHIPENNPLIQVAMRRLGIKEFNKLRRRGVLEVRKKSY